MRNIVIFDTAIGTSNVGDEIILDSIYDNMSDVFSSGFSLRLATHVNNFSAKQMIRRGQKIDFFRNADLKFICGTNLIQQRRIGKINAQWQLYPSNLSIYKNCILIGVGTTDGSRQLDPYAKYLYKSVLSKNVLHSVRDDATKRIIESMGLHAINTGCPTLWKFTPDFCEKIPKKKADRCVVSVSGYSDQRDIRNDQKLINIVLKNYKEVYAWIQTTTDEKYLSMLNGQDQIKRIYSLKFYHDLLKTYRCDYIGTRLHGGVFALQNKCRSIIISIDHRADGFNKSNNLPIVKRNQIENSLEEKINTEWDTNIYINQKSIDKFKGQFI